MAYLQTSQWCLGFWHSILKAHKGVHIKASGQNQDSASSCVWFRIVNTSHGMNTQCLLNTFYVPVLVLSVQDTVQERHRGPHAQKADSVWRKKEDTQEKHIMSQACVPLGDKMCLPSQERGPHKTPSRWERLALPDPLISNFSFQNAWTRSLQHVP